MDSLIISVSGVRGVVGESLTPELLTRFAAAFGTYMKSGRIVVGRDTRVSGLMIKHSVFAGLLSTGARIIDVDVCTTPSVSLCVEELGAAGAVIITGSHNPIEWNALKFLRADGMYLNERQGKELLDIYYQGNFRKARWDHLKPVETDASANLRHKRKIFDVIDVEAIRARAFKVVLDSCNGAGATITPNFLRELGCDVTEIHCEPNGLFPHNPEPLFVNLQDLCATVKKAGADIGFAQDADADRLAIVNEHGQYLGEECTLALACDYVLGTRPGPVVTNLSTTRAIDDIAARYGCPVHRTRVGEVNVTERMKETAGVIGGEGNGGIIDPRVHYIRDSLVGMAVVLEYMARNDEPVSVLAGRIPRYHMHKTKVDCTRDVAMDVMTALSRRHEGENVDRTDGIKMSWDDSWLHVRPSGTEPALRIIAEARDAKKASTLCESVVRMAEGTDK